MKLACDNALSLLKRREKSSEQIAVACQVITNCRYEVEMLGVRMGDGGWEMGDGGWKMEDGG